MAQAVEDLRSLARQYDSQTGSFFPRVSLLVQGNHKFDVQGATGLADDARAMVQVTYNLFNGGADRALRRRIAAATDAAEKQNASVLVEVLMNRKQPFPAPNSGRWALRSAALPPKKP